MKYYKVTQHYYDTGKTTATISTVNADSLPNAEFKNTAHVDIYIDYFTDRKEAEACKEMTLKA